MIFSVYGCTNIANDKWFSWVLDNIRELKWHDAEKLYGHEFTSSSTFLSLSSDSLSKYIESMAVYILHHINRSENEGGYPPFSFRMASRSFFHDLLAHPQFDANHTKHLLDFFKRYFSESITHISKVLTEDDDRAFRNANCDSMFCELLLTKKITGEQIFELCDWMLDGICNEAIKLDDVHQSLVNMKDNGDAKKAFNISSSMGDILSFKSSGIEGYCRWIREMLTTLFSVRLANNESNDDIKDFLSKVLSRTAESEHEFISDTTYNQIRLIDFYMFTRVDTARQSYLKNKSKPYKNILIQFYQPYDEYDRAQRRRDLNSIFEQYEGSKFGMLESQELVKLSEGMCDSSINEDEAMHFMSRALNCPADVIDKVLTGILKSDTLSNEFKCKSFMRIKGAFAIEQAEFPVCSDYSFQGDFVRALTQRLLDESGDFDKYMLISLSTFITRMNAASYVVSLDIFESISCACQKCTNNETLDLLQELRKEASIRLVSDHYYPSLLSDSDIELDAFMSAWKYSLPFITSCDIDLVDNCYDLNEVISKNSSNINQELAALPEINNKITFELIKNKMADLKYVAIKNDKKGLYL
ncbi:hypothetical protein [Aeromonas hydrophila]|uniref:hypothetical protein n=1 Tax=Aeromonas hydrophila TaxID=644 RepID=UPI002B46A300|nr:hypothetical protein [Aeromonas hydrophila]